MLYQSSNSPAFRRDRHRECLTRYALACVLCALALWLPPAAAANEEYLCDREPRRVALVVGNENYLHLEKIPSARTDAEQMRDHLTELGFEVTYVPDVPTRNAFQNEVFKEFRKKLDGGELVVFYFSGHGFSYAGNNYIVPTEMPLNITEAGISKHAISVDSFESLVAGHSPGLIMFFIDACRSLGGFVVPDSNNNRNLIKGFAEQQDQKLGVNSIIFYATRPGLPATGNGAAGQMSVFTRHLINNINTEGRPFLEVFRTVAAEVRVETSDSQIPGPYVFSQTDPYLRPTADILAQEKEAWESVLGKEYDAVEVFYYMNSVSPCAAAIRRWLEDNLGRASRYTRVSPDAIDRAWRLDSAERVSVQRLSLPLFAFPRSLTEGQAATLRGASDAEVGLIRSGTTMRASESLAYSLAAINAHETVVATRRLSGLAEPSASAPVVESIPSGSRLQINGITVGADSSTYVSAATAEDAMPFFIRIPGVDKALQPMELGQSVREIVAPPRPDGLPELVDPGPITAAVEELRRQGWTITWVSLAAAPADAELERERKLQRNRRLVRLMNAEHILKRAGIDGTRITSVAGREDFSGDGVRVRFFGVR